MDYFVSIIFLPIFQIKNKLQMIGICLIEIKKLGSNLN